jgi:hypothetical protein
LSESKGRQQLRSSAAAPGRREENLHACRTVVTYPRILTVAAPAACRTALATLGGSLASGEVVDRPDLLASFDEIDTLMVCHNCAHWGAATCWPRSASKYGKSGD